MRALLQLLTIAALSLAAADNQRGIFASVLYDVIPQVVAGGGWTTSISLLSMEDSEIRAQIKSDGSPWRLAIPGIGDSDSFTLTIPTRGAVSLALPEGGELQQGFAKIDIGCCPYFGAYAVLRARGSGRPDSEAVVPLASSFEKSTTLIFDNTGEYRTGVAIVNARPSEERN
jgi:hypothetical protein